MSLARLGWILLACCGTLAFAALGVWQLGRAHDKERMLESFAAAQAAPPLALAELLHHDATPAGLPRRVHASGHYDDQVTLLLDNQVLDGKPGVDVLTLFVPDDGGRGVLVDRGWLPLSPDRRPPVVPAAGDLGTQIEGLLRAPPSHGIRLGNAAYARGATPPLLAYLDLDALEHQSGMRLVPAVLQLDPGGRHGFTRRWQALPGTMPPERHRGYAVTWFALALLVPVATLVVTWRR